jgi:hypothetical protein
MALAHALWSVEYGETLCTMAMLDDGERRVILRYEADSIPESVEQALADLKPRLVDGAVAALVYDGYYTPDDGERRDALIIELLAANASGESANTASQLGRIAQQYEPGRRALLRKSRARPIGKPSVIGPLPANAAHVVIEGAQEHEKVRDLFDGL